MRKSSKKSKSGKKVPQGLAFPTALTESHVIEELRQNVQKLRIFDQLGKIIASSLDLPEIFQSLSEQISKLIPHKQMSVFLFDQSQETFHLAFPERSAEMRIAFPLGQGLVGEAMARGRGGLHLSPSLLPGYNSEVDGCLIAHPSSLMIFPIMARGTVMGTLVFASGEKEAPLTEEAYRTIETFTDYLSIAVENARNYQRMKELSVTDDLSQLYNSRYLHLVLEREIARSQRYQLEFSIVFIDLDNFKRINDQNGHMAGSSLLREFGAFIAHQIRVSDVGIRYGGDEFVLVLPQTSQESALQFTARLKERLALHDFLKDRDLKVKLTASFGVATFPGNGQTVDELISAADQAMYHVKRGKKNGIYAPAQSSLLLSSLGIKNPGKT